ncbi:hypothetical protein [Beijerinckia mobilis]|uniref:hypothetical protein n=1 Tax=Beijerinckia mobilis TaxID=231434 RepID=UPI0012EB2E23|nr:hypothetical protein [Beijerinckia mobilis]
MAALKDLLVVLRVCSGQIHQEERMASGINAIHTRIVEAHFAGKHISFTKAKAVKEKYVQMKSAKLQTQSKMSFLSDF